MIKKIYCPFYQIYSPTYVELIRQKSLDMQGASG